jgi:hypothetical protein
MKTFTIPAHKDIYKQLELLLSPNGLALVLGSNQNRTDAVSHEALNVILSQRPNWYDNEVLHTIGERDQYTDDWGIPLPSVDIANSEDRDSGAAPKPCSEDRDSGAASHRD